MSDKISPREVPEVEALTVAFDAAEKKARELLYVLRTPHAEFERKRLSVLLGQVANEMFNGHEPVYPSNLLDVISAWLGGYQIHHSHKPIEDLFLAAVARAEAKQTGRFG